MSLSHTVKTIVQGVPTLLTGGVATVRAGNEKLAFNEPGLMAETNIGVTSGDFAEGEPIPARFSKEMDNISPQLAWNNVPARTLSIVLLVEDPDAPLPEPFVHWIAFNIKRPVSSLAQGIAPDDKTTLQQGRNSTLKTGWTGMAPPKGDTPHHYHFQLFALDTVLPLDDGCGRGALIKAMDGHVLARGLLVGTFGR